jgi:hypothetical protein
MEYYNEWPVENKSEEIVDYLKLQPSYIRLN